ncbi:MULTISPECIES: heat-inducible transcriptional repressor HrcA [unclassified Lactobacillus]|uniref:heat-inducible transcriptional repressor HrcA n=1 Tax=unclassified Lactobacillus TaxID=2620435 RepID=UPI000EFD4B19|nr:MULTISPECIES: heat-inducible transcriptional repressor HrcA [unclassified Lactobacillus]RMC24486.1 heat-inducible transcriptional repressor HrcA [Lactobacillus sp. ESL0247]RMC28625.1 heat-inducible transcriptional repressor HrcA [Lactobacillus sp. ESL0246]RMC31817.1 heat-inducible transcriptional repressor HrcA [Lactobacillus sp. ESL0245]RMC48955.1 heat-inducible transcriptional repressor HrcA [Lactobacillus sp. ESL0228]
MLTERQELILKTIINDFTQTHDPVGSKTVMNQLPIKVSSATIRNEMALLEERGLIEKTHLSSGRVPSTDGYRYYLDNLVEPLQIPSSVYKKIINQFSQPFHQVNEIVQEAAKILSDLTNYTAFAEGPESSTLTITGFRIVPLFSCQIMAILVTSDGNVHNQVYQLPSNVNGDEVEKAVRMINDELVGKTLGDVSPTILSHVLNKKFNSSHIDGLIELVEDVINEAASEQMYVDGQINLLNNTSLNDVTSLRTLYDLIDHEDLISHWMSQGTITNNNHSPIQVSLGSELSNDLLKDYSLLTAEYSVGSHGKGVIALLGPNNMPYSQIISLLEYFRNELAKKMLEYYGRFK